MRLAFLFMIYSALGWAVDSAYRSIYEGQWVMHNALKPWPFSPIYGFGAMLILVLDQWFREWPWYVRGGLYGLILGGFEAISGRLAEPIFGRLWSYGNETGWLHGYTNLFYACLWGILSLILVFFLHPFLKKHIPFLHNIF